MILSMESDPVELRVIRSHAFSLATAGGGTVTRAPEAARYPDGTLVDLTATPDPGWSFLQWLGDATGTNSGTSLTMHRELCVEAVFGTSLGVTAVGGGSVTRYPNAMTYPHGTVVQLTGVPQLGNYFALWGGAGSGTNNPLHLIVTNAQPAVTAVFQPLGAGQHALTLSAYGFGVASNSPRGNRFAAGASVTLTAVPESGQRFLGWNGDASGTNNPLVMTMNSSKVIRADFTRDARLKVMRCGNATPGDDFQLLLSGDFGAVYVIEAATTLGSSLADWNQIALVTARHGVVQFNDPFHTNRTQRFYRALLAP